MNEDELNLYNELVNEAKSGEEREAVRAKFLPHMARCIIKANKRIRAIEDANGEAFRRINESLAAIRAKVNGLHSSPAWKDDKIGWLKAHWMELAIALYVLKSLGVDVGSFLPSLLSLT